MGNISGKDTTKLILYKAVKENYYLDFFTKTLKRYFELQKQFNTFSSCMMILNNTIIVIHISSFSNADEYLISNNELIDKILNQVYKCLEENTELKYSVYSYVNSVYYKISGYIFELSLNLLEYFQYNNENI